MKKLIVLSALMFLGFVGANISYASLVNGSQVQKVMSDSLQKDKSKTVNAEINKSAKSTGNLQKDKSKTINVEVDKAIISVDSLKKYDSKIINEVVTKSVKSTGNILGAVSDALKEAEKDVADKSTADILSAVSEALKKAEKEITDMELMDEEGVEYSVKDFEKAQRRRDYEDGYHNHDRRMSKLESAYLMVRKSFKVLFNVIFHVILPLAFLALIIFLPIFIYRRLNKNRGKYVERMEERLEYRTEEEKLERKRYLEKQSREIRTIFIGIGLVFVFSIIWTFKVAVVIGACAIFIGAGRYISNWYKETDGKFDRF